MKWKNKYHWILVLGSVLTNACSETPVTVVTKPLDSTALNYLLQSPGHTVLSQQSVVRFGDAQSNVSLELNGYIIPDERRTNTISARVNGRIEKLYVRFPYEYIHVGQKLMDIYSPELSTAISEHIFLFGKDSTDVLVAESRMKLERLGLSRAQIVETERSRKVPAVITIYSAYEGYNLPFDYNAASIPANTGQPEMKMPGMGNSNSIISSRPSVVLLEGSYFIAGEKLFSVNDAAAVFALLTVPSTIPAAGTQVFVKSEVLPDSVFAGTISFVEPSLRSDQKFLLGRVEMANRDGRLKFNSIVKGTIASAGTANQSLPASSVYDLGTRKIVWVKTGTADGTPVFVPRIVQCGNTSDGQTEIISGLSYGEEVALEAGMMTDREGLIQTEAK